MAGFSTHITVSTLAGNGTPGSQDGGLSSARFDRPGGLAIDRRGDVYVTEWGGHRVRKIDRRAGVRFHAAQAIVLFGGLTVVRMLSGLFMGILALGLGTGAVGLLSMLFEKGLTVAMLVLWIVCMVRAWKGEAFRVPVAAPLADQLAASRI